MTTVPPLSTQPNLLSDFSKILELFDRESTIYKNQISILRESVNELQKKDSERISIMRYELNKLKGIVNNLEQLQTDNVSQQSTNNSLASKSSARNINDYLCQICLDMPRDCILEPCMHFSLCGRCVRQLTEPKCPICRRQIEFYQNVFIS